MIFTPEQLESLQKRSSFIRNCTILAHIDYGKTTLCDSLVASNGIISKNIAGTAKYMDHLPEEQKRGITMKSGTISLIYKSLQSINFKLATHQLKNKKSTKSSELKQNDSPNEDSQLPLHESELYLVNLVDSPGHSDFSGEVSSALRMTDGAIILVDVVEGVGIQTRKALALAYQENLVPILVFNKIDRLIIELNITPGEAFKKLLNLLEEVNSIIGGLALNLKIQARDARHKLKTTSTTSSDTSNTKDWTKTPSKSSSNQSQTSSKKKKTRRVTGFEFFDKMSEFQFQPWLGNVVFTSALHGWGFTINQMAMFLSKKFSMNPVVLNKALWGNYYYHPKAKSRKISKIPPTISTKNKSAKQIMMASEPLFVRYILEGIFSIYKHAGFTTFENKDQSIKKPTPNAEMLERVVSSLGLPKLKVRINNTTPPTNIVREIMKQWLPLEKAIMETVVHHLPPPTVSQPIRFRQLFSHVFSPNQSRMLIDTFKSASQKHILSQISLKNDGPHPFSSQKFISQLENSPVLKQKQFFDGYLNCSETVSDQTTPPIVCFVSKTVVLDRSLIPGASPAAKKQKFSNSIEEKRAHVASIKNKFSSKNSGNLNSIPVSVPVSQVSQVSQVSPVSPVSEAEILSTSPLSDTPHSPSHSSSSSSAIPDTSQSHHVKAPVKVQKNPPDSVIYSHHTSFQIPFYDQDIMLDTSWKHYLLGYARIYSGFLSRGDTIWVLGPKYSPLLPIKDLNNQISQYRISRLFCIMGKDLVEVDTVAAGSIFGIGLGPAEYLMDSSLICALSSSRGSGSGRHDSFDSVDSSSNPKSKFSFSPSIDQMKSIIKTATICTTPFIFPISPVKNDQAIPILRVAIQTKDLSEMKILRRALTLLTQADPIAETFLSDTGDRILATAGELHLELLLSDIKKKFMPDSELIVSEPLVPFRETITHSGRFIVDFDQDNIVDDDDDDTFDDQEILDSETNQTLEATPSILQDPNDQIDPLSIESLNELSPKDLFAHFFYRKPGALYTPHPSIDVLLKLNEFSAHNVSNVSNISNVSNLEDSGSPSQSISSAPCFGCYTPQTYIHSDPLIEAALKSGISPVATADHRAYFFVRCLPMPFKITMLIEHSRNILNVIFNSDAQPGDEEYLPKFKSFCNKLEKLYSECILEKAESSIAKTTIILSETVQSNSTMSNGVQQSCIPPHSSTESDTTLWSIIFPTFTSFIRSIWAFGPNFNGSNLYTSLTSQFSDLRPTTATTWNTWLNAIGIDQIPSNTHTTPSEFWLNNFSSCLSGFVSGFQLASNAGPLCNEPIQGVCFILSSVIYAPPLSGINPRGPFSGQVIAASQQACRESFNLGSVRLVEPQYSCEIQTSTQTISDVTQVLNSRRATILSQSHQVGTANFHLTCYLPAVESSGFLTTLKTHSSGAASATLYFSDQWKILDIDPYWTPITEDEQEEHGQNAAEHAKDNLALALVKSIRKRKGLYISEQVVENADQQRTRKR